ncbi:hypothetical protein ACQKWADRAFT_322436 [Trichoderma austrokoningii]
MSFLPGYSALIRHECVNPGTHALHLANIDFLVLEKRQDVVIDVGACLAIGPARMRVIHQLGLSEGLLESLLESLLEVSHESERQKALAIDGSLVKDTSFYHHLRKKSIVIGADGVHSKMRSVMRQMVMEEQPKRSWDVEYPYLTTYKCLWFSTPPLLRCWVFLCKKLRQPTTQRLACTKEDIEEMMETLPISTLPNL